MHLDRFLHSETGRVMVSIILGLGLASLLRTTCKDKNCVIVHAASMDDISKKTYKHPAYTGCLKYEIVPVKCDKSKKIYHTV
jgi:hypothetical protein